MPEYNFAPPSSGETVEETMDDMLLNSDGTLRGLVGVGTLEAFQELQRRGYVGKQGTLTQKGAQRALVLQREAGWI